MKQIKIINAYKALEPLATNANYGTKEQWELYKLRRSLRPQIEFQEEREKAIVEKYKEFIDENGNISGEPYVNYVNDINELADMNVDLEIQKIELPIVDGINFLTMESLEDFINFHE